MGDVNLRSKLAKVISVSAGSGFAGTTSSTATPVPNLIINVESITGGPIVIKLESQQGSGDSRIGISNGNSTTFGFLQLRKNGSIFTNVSIGMGATASVSFKSTYIPPSSISFTDPSPSPGTNQYQLFYYSGSSFDTAIVVKDAVLVGYEL